MKYIDADRLKAEIEKGTPNKVVLLVYRDIILSLIDSLQQEQDTIVINKKDWEAQEQFQKNKDFGKPIQQEQPEVDLEKEINSFVHGWSIDEFLGLVNDEGWSVTVGDIKNVARHFYELGCQAKPEIFDTVAFQEGVQEGRRLERDEPVSDCHDLEKEIKEQIYERFYDLDGIAVIGTSGYAEVKDMEDIARHFAEWGAEHLKK